ncbi:MAG: alkaline phosphatase [Armatimonadota bacterium]
MMSLQCRAKPDADRRTEHGPACRRSCTWFLRVRVRCTVIITAILLIHAPAWAQPSLRIMPPDRSTFAVDQRFDIRVEASGVSNTAKLTVELNGKLIDKVPGLKPETKVGSDAITLTVRGVSFNKPMKGSITANLRMDGQDGVLSALTRFEVVSARTASTPARNVILMIGDGMGLAHRTAARAVAFGMMGGRYNRKLEMEEMEAFGIASTSSLNSFVTDSANGATAYAGGNKTDNGALCVWPDNTSDPFDNPRFENLASYLKRTKGMAVGVVTTAAVVDATPAAFLAYSYQRGQAEGISLQYLDSAPEVLLGGGKSFFLPSSDGGTRTDGRNLIEEFAKAGYPCVTTAEGLRWTAAIARRCLGLFAGGNLDAYADRVNSTANTQPSLPEMTEAAISMLSRHPRGFFLMVEGACVDKWAHSGDAHRAIWETIEFDRAVGVAKRFAQEKRDTLVIVTADHETGGFALRGWNSTSGLLEVGWGSASQGKPFVTYAPADLSRGMTEPPSYDCTTGVSTSHTACDVLVSASGPGSHAFTGVMDATEVFLKIIAALTPADTANGRQGKREEKRGK